MDKPSLDEIRLTQSVLGLFRYLPSGLWLGPLREAVYRWNPELAGKLDSDVGLEVAIWPAYSLPDTRNVGRVAKTRGGARLDKGMMTPDVVITARDWALVISISPGESTPADQVLQDFLIAQTLRADGRSFLLHINGLSSRQLLAGVRFQSRTRVGPVMPDDPLSKYIAARCESNETLISDIAAIEARLAWLNWQTLHHLLAGIRLDGESAAYVAIAERLLGDAMSTLALAGYESLESDIVEALASLAIDPSSIPRLIVRDPGAADSASPAAAVAQPRPDAKDQAKAKKRAEAEAKKAAEAEAKKEAEAQANKEAEARAKKEAEAQAKKEAEAQANKEVEAKANKEVEATTNNEVDAETEAATVAVAEAEPVPDAAPPAQTNAERPAITLSASAAGIEAFLAGIAIDPTTIPGRFVS